MELQLTTCCVRSLRDHDALSLARHANNRNIWLNLRDGFPNPYSLEDAQLYIRKAQAQNSETLFCIDVKGEAVGSIGFFVQSDIERISAEIGYWLSEAYWGRGIMTEVVKATTDYAVQSFHLHRIYATPFADNKASCHVLEKAGYQLEGRLRKSAIKNNEIIDKLMYAFVVC